MNGRKNSSLKIDLEEENLNNNGFVKAKLEEDEEDVDDNKLHYGLEDTPPWYTCLVLGFQVYHHFSETLISIFVVCLRTKSIKLSVRSPIENYFSCIFQHYVTFVVGIVSVPVVMCPKLCMLEDDAARGELVSTLIFVSGLVTILQTTIGVR